MVADNGNAGVDLAGAGVWANQRMQSATSDFPWRFTGIGSGYGWR